MEFKKDDENYIYEVISKNVKKYRKLKGWTQEKLAEKYPDCEVTVAFGGQPVYYYLVSLE